MPMTSDAKRQLSATIRTLRARLLMDLNAATESAYRLSIKDAQQAGLDEAAQLRRRRFQAWIAEQHRAQGALKGKALRNPDAFRLDAEKQAAYTFLNRLVLLRLMEATSPPLRAPALISGGWESRAYKDFRELAPDLCLKSGRLDESEGYAFLLRLTFEDLALDLPGLYGPAGIADLIPIPPATLRFAIDALNDPALESCWADDMTLGWVYQYWNDPEREALDAKLNAGGKVEPHELASKTQLFTERYMVDWLLQNSLGPLWIAICQKHGWIPDVQADGTLERLESRRADWRAKRASQAVPLTELMPLHSDAERRWAYYLPQPLPSDAVPLAPDSLRDLKLLDPAVGSGHFLVAALELLVPLYQEEARHRGQLGHAPWSDREIVERILTHNLHGIDLDPRAVQIAAAALWLKARRLAPDAQPERLNLVASNLRLSALPENDPALLELRREVEADTGIPAALTDKLLNALRGADHLGSLLKVDRAVDEALLAFEQVSGKTEAQQLSMFGAPPPQQSRLDFAALRHKRHTLIERLELFLAKHSSGDDLGLWLRGEQLASGVRFVRLMREGQYDLVVANPPYQGSSKLVESHYLEATYPLGKADLFAAFLLRGLELVRPGGISAMLTMRNWMFIKQYAGLRKELLEHFDLRALGDLKSGAFEEISAAQVVVSVVMSIFRQAGPQSQSIGHQFFDEATVLQVGETQRKRAATLCQEGRHAFDPASLKVVPEWPLVYWWDRGMLELYQSAPLIGTVAPARKGLCTGNDSRLLRAPWEVYQHDQEWAPTIHGAKGRVWIEPHALSVRWKFCGLEQHVFASSSGGVAIRGPQYYFRRGVAFSMIGAEFSARVHRVPSIFGGKGSSVFPSDLAGAVCAMNSTRARNILTSLNPGIGFEVGDVNRLPLFPIESADEIYARIEAAFSVHESHREPSVEFQRPGPSPWRYAQAWAQEAVDRPAGAPLPVYAEVLDPEPASAHLSFALGVALGRFGDGEHTAWGIRNPASDDLSDALPHGILFLDQTLDANELSDGLGHPACRPLLRAWKTFGPTLSTRRSLREYLAQDFFKEVHRGMYENRPIHWPLCSANKTFVAWVHLHRLNGKTLPLLLADHLKPTLTQLEGQLKDLRELRDGTDAKAAKAAERPLERLLKAREELTAFIALVEQCAERGAPPTDAKCPGREQDRRYQPTLDDGVMINASALWPLLEPQWKDPKKWWKELATAEGRKDYDWSHLAAGYWPQRVDRKCQQDPSLGVAHGCFWRYHPARAFAWELRLQDELGPDFVLHEGPYQGDGGDEVHRRTFLASQPTLALETIEKEVWRRRRKSQQPVSSLRLWCAGLWSSVPEQVWALELRLLEKQGLECLILAPDEGEARLAYCQAHPEAVDRRDQLRKALLGQLHLLPAAEAAEAEDTEDTEDTEETAEEP